MVILLVVVMRVMIGSGEVIRTKQVDPSHCSRDTGDLIYRELEIKLREEAKNSNPNVESLVHLQSSEGRSYLHDYMQAALPITILRRGMGTKFVTALSATAARFQSRECELGTLVNQPLNESLGMEGRLLLYLQR